MSKNIILVAIYHRHKLLHLKKILIEIKIELYIKKYILCVFRFPFAYVVSLFLSVA
jgi:hypothetical protein